jgi:Uma2 family endonuclease
MIAITETQNSQKLADGKPRLTFEQFLELCPTERRYEFVNGQIVDTSGKFSCTKHNDAVELIALSLANRINLVSCNYDIAKNFRINQQSNFLADLCIFRKKTKAPLVQFVIEIVSTDWEDDYIDKFLEYQSLKISEYWIIDYMAIASREFLGNPKVPTVFVNLLDENGKYQTTRFTGDDKIISRTFPEVDLTAAQILNI